MPANNVTNMCVSTLATLADSLAIAAARAVEVSVHDLLVGSSPPVQTPITVEITGGRRAGFAVYAANTNTKIKAFAASGLQDAFVEEFMSTSPLCPGHQHPLNAHVRSNAIWKCPRDENHFSCPIGSYDKF